ncbi:MAG: hypothetical protein WKF83_12520 [Nocardioidaceae bacterium]
MLAAHDFDGAGRVGTFEQRNGAEHVDAIVAGERIRRYGEAVIAAAHRGAVRHQAPAAGYRSYRRSIPPSAAESGRAAVWAAPAGSGR